MSQMIAAVYEMLMKRGPTEAMGEARSEAEVARLFPNATNSFELISLSD